MGFVPHLLSFSGHGGAKGALMGSQQHHDGVDVERDVKAWSATVILPARFFAHGIAFHSASTTIHTRISPNTTTIQTK